MPTTPGLQCRVPIRVRLVGEPTDEDLAGLEAAVARAVARQLAMAERLWARTGWPEGTRAPERGTYQPWQERPGDGAYEVPSYQRAGEPVRVPLQKQLQPVGPLAFAARAFVRNYQLWVGFDVDGAAEALVRWLDRDPTAYAFVRAVFDAIPSDFEDNVAAEFLDRTPDARLHVFTLSTEGLAMLDVLYEAMITGSVSKFERKQAERILRAKSYRTTQAAFLEGLEHLRIFPIRNIGVTRLATATFRAELLPNGKVRVRYTSSGLYDHDMFKADRETLPGYSQTMNGFELDPEEIVAVRLYDLGHELVPISALELIDYSNQMQEQTIGTATTAFLLGLTLGSGALASTAVRELGAKVLAGEATMMSLWIARGVLWADRVAFFIPAGSMVINDHRDWILENWPTAGRTLLDVVDTANRLAAYYGWGRLGVGTIRFLGSRMRGALDGWRETTAKARGVQQRLSEAVGNEAESLANELAYAEETAIAAPMPSAGGGGSPATAGARVPSGAEVLEELNRELGLEPASPSLPSRQQPRAPGDWPSSGRPIAASTGAGGVAAPQILESAGASTRGPQFQSASAQTTRSIRTAIIPDVGEVHAYKEALLRGEVGLQRPLGANVPGADFITAAREGPRGELWVIISDAKTRSVATSAFPTPATSMPAAWRAEAAAAVAPGRLVLGNAQLEAEIAAAFAAGRIRPRQLNVDLSPVGQGQVTGW